MKDDDDKNLTEHRRNVQAADRAPSQYWMGPRSAGTWSPGHHDHDEDDNDDNDNDDDDEDVVSENDNMRAGNSPSGLAESRPCRV